MGILQYVILGLVTGVSCVDRQKIRIFPQPAANFDLQTWITGDWYTQARYMPCSFAGSREFSDIRVRSVLNGKNIKQIMNWRQAKLFHCRGDINYNRDGVCSTSTIQLTVLENGCGVFIQDDIIGGMVSGNQVTVVYNQEKGYDINWGCTRRSSDGKTCSDPWISVKTRDRFPDQYVMKCVARDLKRLYELSLLEMTKVTHQNPGTTRFPCCLLYYVAKLADHTDDRITIVVDGLLGRVPSFKKLRSSRCDDWIDHMNHVYSVLLLVIFAVVVSTTQFVGDPIHCWCPAQFTEAHVTYTKNYCWIKNTYFVPMLQAIPVDVKDRQDAEITYYQWVPLILLFQAFMFKFPNVLWKMLNGGSGLNLDKICKLADETQIGSPADRKTTIENLAFFLDKWLQTHRPYRQNIVLKVKAKMSGLFCFICNKREGTFLTALYLTIKVLYLGNVIGQFFLLNAFMATDYYMYGIEYIQMMRNGETFRESARFPRITLCDVQIRQLQNIQRWSVQCVLPVNLFNEKIFIFLWFWFFLVACFSAISLFKWMYLIVFKRNNYQYVKKYLVITEKVRSQTEKALCRHFADKFLRDDGCFVARMIGKNSTDMVVTDLLDCMWVNYRARHQYNSTEHTSDTEKKLLHKHNE